MARRVRRVLLWVGGGVALLVVAVAVALVTFDWSRLGGTVAGRAGQALHRTVHIGNLDVRLGRIVRVTADRVTIDNARWGSYPRMAEIGQVVVDIDLLELVRGRTVLPQLRVVQADVLLEKNEDGAANWDFSENPEAAAAAKAVKPERRSEFPIIERLAIEQGRLFYRDPVKGIDIASQVNTAVGGDPAHQQVFLKGSGSFQNDPFTLSLEGGSLLTLRNEKVPYPLKIEAAIGKTRARVEGTLTDPLRMGGLDVRLALEGPDMAAVFPILGIPIPSTAPYGLEGMLRHHGDEWALEGFSGRVGESDLSGDLSVQTGGARPFMRARLASDHLRIDDLAGFVGARPGQPEPATDRVLPDKPVNVERLRAMDMEVQFTANNIQSGNVPLKRLDASLGLDNGLLVLDPLDFTLKLGDFSGRVVLDGRKKVPAAEADLRVNRVDLGQFFETTRFAGEMSGTFAGRIRLIGHGRSTAQLLGSSDGQVSLFVDHGSVSNLMLAVAGLDIAQALGLLATEDKPVALRCLVADFAVRGGQAQAQTLVLDATDSLLTGSGTVDLGAETMDLRIEAHPKTPSPLSARSPVLVSGRWTKPKVGVEAGTAVARGGVAAALGALLTPLAALLPFLEPGLGQDSPCASMIQEAKKPE